MFILRYFICLLIVISLFIIQKEMYSTASESRYQISINFSIVLLRLLAKISSKSSTIFLDSGAVVSWQWIKINKLNVLINSTHRRRKVWMKCWVRWLCGMHIVWSIFSPLLCHSLEMRWVFFSFFFVFCSYHYYDYFYY